MPSKGVDFYAFVAGGYEIEIRKANAGEKDDPATETVKADQVPAFFSKHYEIETNNWKIRYEGKFQFIAKKDGRQLFERSIRVNGNTGNIQDEDLNNIMIPSRVEGDYSLSFGLYDSDSGTPNAHQLYATLTPNRSSWQGDFFKTVNTSATRLKDMVLPGSHDAGMYNGMFVEASNMANTQKDSVKEQLGLGARYFDYRPGIVKTDFRDLLQLAADNMSVMYVLLMAVIAVVVVMVPFVGTLLGILLAAVGYPALLILKGKMRDLANYISPKIEEICHVHAVIPGETMAVFFGEIVEFLKNNTNEIVVINMVDSGIIRNLPIPASGTKISSMLPDGLKNKIPSFMDISVPDIVLGGRVVNGQDLSIVQVPGDDELLKRISIIADKAGINIGDKSHLDVPVSELIKNNTRLIIFFKDAGVSSNDSYNDDYSSYDSDIVKKALEKALNHIDNADFTKLQLQLTPTGTKAGIFRAVKGTNVCTSPLFATKPRTDLMSYQLLLNRALKVKSQGKMVAVQNDFYDNALTEVAIMLNRVNNGIIKPFDDASAAVLQSDGALTVNATITSANKWFRLILQNDGNLVLYNALNQPLWATGINGKQAQRAIMQADGNLVVYTAANDVLWAANRAYSDFKFVTNARLMLDDDGTLGIYEPGGNAIKIIRQG